MRPVSCHLGWWEKKGSAAAPGRTWKKAMRNAGLWACILGR